MSDTISPRALDPEGVPDGSYVLTVSGGHVTGLTPAPSGDGSGSGSGTAAQSYVGTNAVGGTWVTMTNRRMLMKKVTLATAGLLTSIEAYIDSNGGAGKVDSFAAVLYADNAGAPREILQPNILPSQSLLATDGSTLGNSDPRWLGLAIGRWLTAGSYWLGVAVWADPTADIGLRIATATGGSDRYYTSGGDWIADAGFYAVTTTTTDNSIRANVLTL